MDTHAFNFEIVVCRRGRPASEFPHVERHASKDRFPAWLHVSNLGWSWEISKCCYFSVFCVCSCWQRWVETHTLDFNSIRQMYASFNLYHTICQRSRYISVSVCFHTSYLVERVFFCHNRFDKPYNLLLWMNWYCRNCFFVQWNLQ